MKKILKPVGFLMFLSLTIFSCKKDVFETTSLASLTIVNTVTGGTTAKFGSLSNNINNNAASYFTIFTGNPDIYVWPVTDSLMPYYNSNKAIAVADRDYFTLFLTGTTSSPEGILVKEDLQPYGDSVLGVRFVNLSPNSTPVNVTLSTSTTVNEFESISYKQFSMFKLFPAVKSVSSYNFQVRSASNPGTILSSMTISLTASGAPRFRNLTLVFRGNVGGSPAPGITRVNHY